jgi:F5/8 type C domain
MRLITACKPLILLVVPVVLVGALISSPFATPNVFATQPVLKFVTASESNKTSAEEGEDDASQSNETSSEDQAAGIVLPPDILGGGAGGVITGDQAGEVASDPANFTVLSQSCIVYEVRIEPTFKAETCAKIVQYHPSNKIFAFAQQWVGGYTTALNKVYDGTLPDFTCNDYDEIPGPGGAPDTLSGCENKAVVYELVRVRNEVRTEHHFLILEFKPGEERLDLRYRSYEYDPTTGLVIKTPPHAGVISQPVTFSWSGLTNPNTCGDGRETITAVTAKSSESTSPPKYAVDKNVDTKWMSTSTLKPWIKADLGHESTVCKVDIAWADGSSRQYTFIISVSLDGTNFVKVLSGKSSGSTSSPESYSFAETNARYVRIMLYESTDSVAQISEMAVTG